MSDGNEILLPTFDDDESVHNFGLPSFSNPSFGASSSTTSLDIYPTSEYPRNASVENLPRPSLSTPARPTLQKTSVSYSTGYSTPGDERRLGKLSNGSNASLATPGTSIGSAPGFLPNRKGSLASIKNAFKPTGPTHVPPVPNLNTAYPALRNPFSRFEPPASPSYTSSPRQHNALRKQPTASGKSTGGRSANSQSSLTYRPSEDNVSLPPVPSRSTPSRRQGSDTSAYRFLRQGGSIRGLEDVDEEGPKSAADEALQTIWADFRSAADSKVARICGRPLNTQPSLPAYLEVGMDPPFDALLVSFGHLGIRHARRVFDIVNAWCKHHCEGIGANEVRSHMDRSAGASMRLEEAAAILSDRKSSASKFLLNRVLLELIAAIPRDILAGELGLDLEQNAFNAFRSENLEEMQLPHRQAVSQLEMRVLGALSNTRFLTVSDRFSRELAKLSTSQARDSDARMEHLLHGVRQLKLKVYPESELENSAEFVQELATLYINVQREGLRLAYTETFTHLLHPVAETATAEVNHPLWSKAVDLILSRSQTMVTRPRNWSIAFPLVIVALAVSPREVFMSNWISCLEAITTRLRDRPTRPIAINALHRMLWVYLNRCSESSTSMRKRLDPIIRLVYSTNGGLLGPDLPVHPFAAILHAIMARDLEYGEEFISEFLRGDALAQMDRTTSLVRAIGRVLQDLVEDRPAAWPSASDFESFDEDGTLEGEPLSDDLSAKPEITSFLIHAKTALTELLLSCDRSIGFLLLSNDNVSVVSHSSSAALEGSEQVTRKHGDIYVTFSGRHVPTMRLCATLLDLMPRCLDATNFGQVANILCRSSFSADPVIAAAAGGAIRRCSQDSQHCLALATTFMQFVFETRHVFRDTFMGVRLLERQFDRVTEIWLDLLQTLVGHQRLASTDEDEGGLKLAAGFIQRIEGCGLFLLCSTSLSLRRLATRILAAARDLEPQRRMPSAPFRYSRINIGKETLTRVVQLFEMTLDEGEIKRIRSSPWLNSTDRHRLDLLAAEKSRLLARIAESDNSKDAALWLGIFPLFVGKLVEQIPDVAQCLRSVVITMVLRLQGHIAVTASNAASRATPGMRTHPSSGRNTVDMGSLAEYWRAYLSVLCVTMPGQLQTPATPPVQRTKDVIILTPDTISSPALFHYLTWVFGWEDPRFKDAAVYAIGAIGQALLRPVSDIMLGVVRRLADGSKMAASRRSMPNAALWTALAHVFRLISPLLLESRASQLNNLSSIISFVKITHSLLSERGIKDDFDLQSLRRSFCIVVENLTNALGKLDSSERFLGEDMRGAIFKLCFEWCHIGRRPDVAKARESHMLQAAAEGYRGERDRAQYLDDLQAKTKLLSAAAADAMAGLCQGKLISNETTPAAQISEHVVEPLTVLRWIRGMFSSPNTAHHETASKALFALIKYNWHCTRLLDEVLHQSFGEGEQFSLDSSFFGVVADTLAEGLVQLPVQQTACLCLSKLGHPVADVRQRAFQLCLSLVSEEDRNADCLERLYPSVGSQATGIYLDAQKQIAACLARVYGDRALDFLTECTARLGQLEAPRRQATLSIIPAWLSHLDLAPDTSMVSDEDAKVEHGALSNLMYLSVRFGDDHLDEIRRIFKSFAESPDSGNTHALTRYLFDQGSRRKSLDFVSHAQRVMACLAQSTAVETMFDDIFSLVEPSAMAALPEANPPPESDSSLVNLDSLFTSHSKSQVFSTGQLALLFIGELLPLRLGEAELSKRMLTLLHVALIHCDHPGSALRDQCQSIFFQVLRAWTCDTSLVRPDDSRSAWSIAQAKVTSLSRARGSIFWKSDDAGAVDSAFSAPTKMSTLILKVFGILLPLQPRLRQQWGELALLWATSCPIRHLACRSFQVYRVLGPRVNARMISDTLARLSSTIASASPEILSFNLEVLRTFTAIVQNLSASEASNHPQLFWCTMACLTTPFEDEFTEVIELLSHILDKFNLSDPETISQLMANRPAEWVGPAPHLQSLLLVGLRSSKTVMMTFDLIRRLASSPNDELVDASDDRLLNGFVAALPWMLQSTDIGEPNEELATMALDLAAIAEAQGHQSFARLLTSFAHVRFRSKDDFVSQACSLLRDFCRDKALEVVTILLGFVLNSHDWMREKAITVLKILFQYPEARACLVHHGDELLAPILRLVGTNYATSALDLLDLPVMQSDQTKGKSIFGHIESSGWCIPSAKDLSIVTRDNVSAVFKTCAKETRAASAHYSVVQFKDMKPFENPSQVSLDLPSPQASTVGVMENASLGDLVGALHSLNQFFDDGLEGSPERTKTKGYHYKQPSESLSDRRLRIVMARGRHNQSISSPISEKSLDSTRKHQHTISDSTASTTSSDHNSDDLTRRPLQTSSGVNVDRFQARAGVPRPRFHAQNPSYSSTDMDSSVEFDRIEANLWGLEDDTANVSSGSLQSHFYAPSGGSTPNGRRAGFLARSEESSGDITPSIGDD
ncbi:cell morphogenesis N-terminal-domain-containing protein [Kockovaella imperatae]|uniref:Cell morphogenesis N-terminal-domain-containing protein n=1 Tax=Kockovaella imperatae TaxID=4999 RepID=A0A1Y1UNT1_9TREE|nr:cell morphogenesis N-terminal-domain-containing protein [Kockovaella imperatae]ORX39679.1 cell morphogenesis N-terminal-domain-containing protein [Kockovaella imperatae]